MSDTGYDDMAKIDRIIAEQQHALALLRIQNHRLEEQLKSARKECSLITARYTSEREILRHKIDNAYSGRSLEALALIDKIIAGEIEFKDADFLTELRRMLTAAKDQRYVDEFNRLMLAIRLAKGDPALATNASIQYLDTCVSILREAIGYHTAAW